MAQPMTPGPDEPWVPPDTFGSRLVALRRHLHLSQDEAAARAGLNPKTWNTWENGTVPRGMNEIVGRISETFGVDRNWLMWGHRAFGYKPDFTLVAEMAGQMELPLIPEPQLVAV
jgi:transcriptional regulator with XRE-family HTH domain